MTTQTRTTASASPTGPDGPDGTPPSDPPRKLAAMVVGLTAVLCVMLFAFAAPALESGAHDLPLAVSGPAAATGQLVDNLEERSPGTFDVTTFDSAEEGAAAIRDREAVGGFAIGPDGVTIQIAAGAGSPYKTVLTGIGAQLQEAGQTVTYEELAPTTADDPSGSAIGSLGLPLVFGGLAASAAMLFAYRGTTAHRLVATTALAVLGGLATTAILQFGFGAFDANYWLISAAVAVGILAIAYPVLGLARLLGTPGLALMAVTLMFLANPLGGLATGPQWLPGVWGEVGQLLPVGAAGTAIRSGAYFDGAGATQAWIVLACWALAGLAVALLASRRPAPQPAAHR
jgi:hypothetical protein